MPDTQSSSGAAVNAEFYRGAIETTPEYFQKFVGERAADFSKALRDNDREEVLEILVGFSELLPKNQSFREIAALLCRRKNGDMFITTVDGNIDEIGRKKAGDLLDDLIQAVPVDTEQILFIHTHPCPQGPFGPEIPKKVGWSPEDGNFISVMGEKLMAFELEGAHIGLVTANTKKVILNTGKNLGRAFGWQFETQNSVEQRFEHSPVRGS